MWRWERCGARGREREAGRLPESEEHFSKTIRAAVNPDAPGHVKQRAILINVPTGSSRGVEPVADRGVQIGAECSLKWMLV